MPFVEEPVLEPGERVVDTFEVRRTEDVHAVPGKLWVTTTHVRFRAHLYHRGPMGRAIDCPWSHIAGVDRAPRSWRRGPFRSSLRRRLRVRLTDGYDELFFVHRVRARAAQLQRLREAARPRRSG